jgi:hypothetical protein
MAKAKLVKKFRDVKGYASTLRGVLDDVERHGIKEEDFGLVDFDLDYSDCYYESDAPSINWTTRIPVG